MKFFSFAMQSENILRKDVIMLKLIIEIICIIIILLGVICIFDARLLTKRFFGFGDQNEGASGLKILGFVIVMLSGIVLMFLIKK